MSFLFKSCSLVKVIYLLVRFCKTCFFLWNLNNTDRNGVNKQITHTHTETHTQTHLILLRKIWTWPFLKTFENSNPSATLTKKGGGLQPWKPSVKTLKVWLSSLKRSISQCTEQFKFCVFSKGMIFTKPEDRMFRKRKILHFWE